MEDPLQEADSERLSRLLADQKGEPRQAADHLIRRLTPIFQRELRRPLLSQLLKEMDDALLLSALTDLLQRARAGAAASREIVQELALEPGLVAHMPYERVEALYRLANRHRLLDIQGIFLSTRVRDREESHTENDFLTLPLGARKQAARTRDRFLLDRLLRDRNVEVIRNLLANPRITERDLLLITSMRPTRPEILQAVAEHPRWGGLYRVRKALACNPHTPSAIALNLLSTLMIQDLHFLLSAGVMAPEVHAEAERLVALRGRDRARAALEGVLEQDVDELIEEWGTSEKPPEADLLAEVGEIALNVPTSEAVIAAHLAAERDSRQRVLRALEYPDPETRDAYLPTERRPVVLEEDHAAPEELSDEVSQLMKEWLILDPSISAELVALASVTEIEALPPDEAPKVGWPEPLPTPPPEETPEELSATEDLDPVGLEVARLIRGWQRRDGAVSDDFIASADDLVVEAVEDSDD